MALSKKTTTATKKRTPRVSSSRTDIVQRLEQLEQELALMRLNLVTAREQAALAGWRSGKEPELDAEEETDIEEQQQRLIGIVDLIWQHLPEYRQEQQDESGAKPSDPSWEMLYWEVREVLAAHQLRPEVPEGAFDPALAQAVELVPADREADHRTVQRVLKPAIVRETEDGTVVIRAGSVVVWDATLPAEAETTDDEAAGTAPATAAVQDEPAADADEDDAPLAAVPPPVSDEEPAPAADEPSDEAEPVAGEEQQPADPREGNGVRVAADPKNPAVAETDAPVTHPDEVRRILRDEKGTS